MLPRLRVLLLLLPAGCATPGEREAVALRAAMESSQASLAAVAPAGIPPALAAPVSRSMPRTQRAHPDLHPVAIRSGPAPAAAAQLLGAGPEALRRWLGAPSLRRREGSAEVWLYSGEACALDLILYPAGGGLRVAHAEARASGPEPRTEADCLGEIAAAQAPSPIPAGSPGEVAGSPAEPGV